MYIVKAKAEKKKIITPDLTSNNFNLSRIYSEKDDVSYTIYANL